MLATANFIAIVTASLGYLFGSAFAGLAIAASWLIMLPALWLYCRVDLFNAVGSVLVFDLLAYSAAKCKSRQGALSRELGLMVAGLENEKRALSAELSELNAADKGEKARELAVVTLYDFTKKLSQSLRFDEIFPEFTVFLKERFDFRRSELIILDEKDACGIDRVYELWGAPPEGREGERPEKEGEEAPAPREVPKRPRVNVERLFGLVRDGKEVFLDRQEDADSFKGLELEEGVRTFLAVPLLSEKRTVAIIIVEDLRREQLDEFIILSRQFALEIKRVLLYETVEALAITDGLTDVYVRRYFLERLEEELQRSKRHGLKFSFVMVDIDHFKECNDSYGHLVGDVVLRETARLIKTSVREIDLVSRYGGEEFSLLLPETDKDGGARAAERIRKKIEESEFRAYDETLKVRISAGVATYPDDGLGVEAIIENADRALYKAKRSGRNCISVYLK